MTLADTKTDNGCSNVTIDVAKDLKYSDNQWSAHYTWTYPSLGESNSLKTMEMMTMDMSHIYTSTIY